MPEEIDKEYLDEVLKGVKEVGELLKNAPTREEFEKMTSDMAELKKSAEIDPAPGFSKEEVDELVKNAVADAVKPLTEKIDELENSKVFKGMQDFDFAKMKAEVPADEPETDFVKSAISASYGIQG
jgi:regulator of sirC expression with transglutaminase-like and TPR domain